MEVLLTHLTKKKCQGGSIKTYLESTSVPMNIVDEYCQSFLWNNDDGENPIHLKQSRSNSILPFPISKSYNFD